MKKFKLLVLSLGVLTPTFAFAASFHSISDEKRVTYADGDYFVVEVGCTNGNTLEMQRKDEEDARWCGKDAEGFCRKALRTAARQVCSRDYLMAVIKAQRNRNDEAGEVSPVAAKKPSQPQKTVMPPPQPAQASPANPSSGLTGMELDDESMPQAEESASGKPVMTEPATEQTEQESLSSSALTITSRSANAEEDTVTGEDAAAVAAKREALELEERRLQIEKERLEIRKQDLEVQRQAYELRQKLEEEEARRKAEEAERLKKAEEAEKVAKQEEQQKKPTVPVMFRSSDAE